MFFLPTLSAFAVISFPVGFEVSRTVRHSECTTFFSRSLERNPPNRGMNMKNHLTLRSVRLKKILFSSQPRSCAGDRAFSRLRTASLRPTNPIRETSRHGCYVDFAIESTAIVSRARLCISHRSVLRRSFTCFFIAFLDVCT